MKRLFVLAFLVLCSCSPTPIVSESKAVSLSTKSIPPTVYTSIVDYQSTIVVANKIADNAIKTADAVIRLNIQATSEHEKILQERIRFTHEVEMITAQSVSWTATSYLTSVPLTATQQAVLNTQIPIQQNLLAGQITSTHEAPELLLKKANASNTEKYGFIEYIVKFVFYISLSFFLVYTGLWLRSKPLERLEIYEEEETQFIIPIDTYTEPVQETVIAVTKAIDNYPSKFQYTFPCTDEQLDELADKVISKGMSLAYDNFTGSNSKFTRETYAPVYSFLQANRLAISTGVKNKGIILTDRSFGEVNGRDILTGWLETRTLPSTFATSSTTPLLQPVSLLTGISRPIS